MLTVGSPVLTPPIFALLALTQTDAPVVNAEPYPPVTLVITTPTGSKNATLPLSEITRQFHEGIEASVSLGVRDVAAELIAHCRGAMVCIMAQAQQAAQAKALKFALVFSSFAQNSQDAYTFVLVDAAAVSRCEGGPTQAERCANRAVLERQAGTAKTKDEARALITKFVDGPLKHWANQWRRRSYGAVKLEVGLPDVRLELEGREIGKTGPQGSARIEGLSPGSYGLRLQLPGFETKQLNLSAKAGQTGTLSTSLSPLVHPARTISIWSGTAVAALGAAFVVWGAVYASQNGRVGELCFEGCGGSAFWTLEQMAKGAPEPGEAMPNQGGVLAIPLGYSLALTGGLLALSSAFLGDSHKLPWIEWLVALGAGALAYGVSVGIDAAVQ